MKKITFLLIFSLLATTSKAQDAKYVPGEFLVQLSENYSTKSLIEDSNKANLTISKPVIVSKSMNIWKFNFDAATMSMKDVLDQIHSNNNVINVQVNHILKKRVTTPNDSGYSQQWQYYQSNDKDIDADEAWDITTGGTTANGHEIVVAVIDDGLQLDHPDIVGNVWTNTQEIANNGIDDDGNGYIDDVKGWNTSSNNDNISSGWHGTPVSGIIGAKGNNSIGVAGVNWNVKVMIIEGGSGVEEEVIRAYSYAMDNRVLYNQTNGSKGAFVVATNASWGVDYGQPADAPLWCAFYDTLGENGILNAGATINGNEDVDAVGDLPTACPSDFMISVTNMNQNDVKVTQAGYGSTTIDLGAHGQGAYTIAYNSGYGGFGGTSGATPHVAGAIALLYSAPSMAFAELAISDPELAATKVRGYILDNVDPNPSLENITVTEGRLNLFNSLEALINDQSLSIDEVESYYSDELIIYPNPAKDIINFDTKSNTSVESVWMYTMSGKLIKSSFEDVNSIDVSNLSQGSYILRYKLKNRNRPNHTILLKK